LETYSEQEDGFWVHRVTSSQAIPRSAAEIVTSDSVKIEYVDKKGVFQKQHWIESEQGEVKTQITLERVKGNKYTYKGRLQGKDIEGTFSTKSKTGLSTDFQLSLSVAKILKKGKEEQILTEEYMPNVDPSGPIEASYSIRVEAGVGKIVARVGQLEMSAVADKEGLIEQSSMPIGSRTMIIKRIFSDGVFPGTATQ
jgi:hypothetical protein